LKIIVLVGLPGSGKSTYLENLRRDNLPVNAISSDEMRRLLADDVTDQTIHRRVFASMRYLVRQRLALSRPVTYVDATHLTPGERRPYIVLANLHDGEAEALFFDVPLEVCLARNRLRPRVVPDDVIRQMARRLVPPSIQEGFARVTLAPQSSPI
jgi:predicted kinase